MTANLRGSLTVLFLFVLTISWSTGPEGTYVYNSNNKTGAGGVVYIHKTEESKYLFYFEYNTGDPSYNSNAEYGYIRVLEETTFENHWNQIGNRIEFVFDPDYTTVTLYGQLRGMVSYKKKSSKNPASFVNRKGDKIFFSKTNPEDYSE